MKKIIALVVCLSVPASANYAFVQSNVCTATGVTVTCTYSTNPLSGNLLIVAVAAGCVGTCGAVSLSGSNGASFTSVGSDVTSANNNAGRGNIFYAANSNAGTTVVSSTVSSAGYITVALHEYSGLATTSPFDVTSSSNPAASLSSFTSTNGTTASANELMFGFLAAANGTENAANGNLRVNNLQNELFLTEDANVASASAYASTFGLTTANFGWMIQAAFKLPVVAGGGGMSKMKKMEIYE